MPFDKLIISVAMGNRDEDTLISLAGRLAGLNRESDDSERIEIETAAANMSLS